MLAPATRLTGGFNGAFFSSALTGYPHKPLHCNRGTSITVRFFDVDIRLKSLFGEALDAHSKSDHFREANKILAGLVAAAPEVELLPAVTR